MNQKVSLQVLFPILLALLLLAAIGLLSQQFVSLPALQIPQISAASRGAEPFDPERMAEVSAARWQAMGKAYTGGFDVERAAEVSAARWQAMGKAYTGGFDYERAAEVSAARWQAMGEAYSGGFDYERAAEVSAARWQAMGEHYKK